jgi:hypothetical protein
MLSIDVSRCLTLTKQHGEFFKICRISCNNKRFNTNCEVLRLTITGQHKNMNTGACPVFEPIVTIFEWLVNNENGSHCPLSKLTLAISRQQEMRGLQSLGSFANVPSCECVMQFAYAATRNMGVEPTDFPTIFHCRGTLYAHGI